MPFKTRSTLPISNGMKEALDKDFFKFLAGFASILTVAIVGILAVGYYEMQNGSGSASAQPGTTQVGL